jgi:hypothetical protein
MAIKFVPNDPLAKNGPPPRNIKPRAARSAGLANFSYTGEVPERVYNIGTAEFLYWQCREAALLSVEVWEGIDGKLAAWGPSSPKKLELLQNAGVELNAGYSQTGLEFYQFTTGSKTTFSGASTDVVAHEVGHALLDVIRPDLWNTSFPETNAFHEAFGDCMAILTALSDKQTREELLKATPDVGKSNFVETVMEDLADGTKREYGANFDGSAPRRALNDFKWQLPTTLPTSGKPSVLTSEVHSFGRLFSGCFYDAIRNIFLASSSRTPASLWKAAQVAGKLLVAGARQAPETARFFQSVGRAMILADQSANQGANRDALRAAFTRHEIALGSAAMLAPRASLPGPAPKLGGAKRGGILTATTRDDLKRRIGAPPSSRMSVTRRSIGGVEVAEATNYRNVALGDLSRDLRDVVIVVAEPMLIGSSGKRAALLSSMPQESVTTDEVHTFVQTLLEKDSISFDRDDSATPVARGIRSAGARRSATETQPRRRLPTHTVRLRGDKKVLERIRFVC